MAERDFLVPRGFVLEVVTHADLARAAIGVVPARRDATVTDLVVIALASHAVSARAAVLVDSTRADDLIEVLVAAGLGHGTLRIPQRRHARLGFWAVNEIRVAEQEVNR